MLNYVKLSYDTAGSTIFFLKQTSQSALNNKQDQLLKN